MRGALLALMVVAAVAADPSAEPRGGQWDAPRGGTSGVWLHRGGTPQQGIGRTTVPEQGEQRSAVVDQAHSAGPVGLAARIPYEASRVEGHGSVLAEAVLEDVLVSIAGHEVQVATAHAWARATCLVDGTVELEASGTVSGVRVDGDRVDVGRTTLGAGPVQLVVDEQVVDEGTGDVEVVALQLLVGSDRVTVATAAAGIDCAPAT